MSQFVYETPLDIAIAFNTRNDIAEFLSFLIDKNRELVDANRSDQEFLPPIVFNIKGRAFNIDYNFIIDTVAIWLGEDTIFDDFRMNESQNESSLRNAFFLIVGIFEQYFGVVFMNNPRVDLARYKNRQIIDVSPRFYNMIIMKNGSNFRRYSAVGFSASAVKKLVSSDEYAILMTNSCNPSFELAAFGVANCQRLVNEITRSIPNVTA